MSRPNQNSLKPRIVRATARMLLGAALSSAVLGAIFVTASSAAALSPSARGWCGAYGSSFATWSETAPNIPICGPGPAYGGAWDLVTLPGPGGTTGAYFNGTPGFQCVELAERYLAVAYGFAPISAEGSTVAQNYHAVYPRTTLTVNRTRGVIGHAPVRGDVISLSLSSSFGSWGDGHVAVVAKSEVNRTTGNGRIVVAQQNVSSSDYLYTIDLVNWRLEDSTEPGNAEFQFPYAEWLHIDRATLNHRPSVLISSASVPTRSLAYALSPT